MKEFRERDTGELLSEKEVEKKFPRTMASKPWSPAALDTFNIDPVLESPKPAASSLVKVVVRNGAIKDVKGNWVQSWQEQDMFSDDENSTKAEKEETYLAEIAEKERDSAIAAINEEFEAEVSVLKKGYAQDEIDSWPEQLAQARAYDADNSASTPIIDKAIEENGRTKAEQASRILANAQAYSEFVGAALGRKQKKIADLG